MADFVHFLQAHYCVMVDLTYKNLASSAKWLSRERISCFLSKQIRFHGNK